MHGLGNDYVYVDCFQQRVENPSALAETISDRHFGVGSDGLILILPSDAADVRMRVFNSDGSEGRMCGNGVRCLAKYAFEHGLIKANPVRVQTASGVKTVWLDVGEGQKVLAATVDMGEPVLDGAGIGVRIAAARVLDYPVATSRGCLKATCVSMGNPHAVIYPDGADAASLETIGPELQRHELFPGGINVHLVQVSSPGDVTVRTWERGSGPTLACGTGAAAVCVAGVLTGRTGRAITARLPGGDLGVEWRQSDGRVYITGPAVEVFSGEWPGAA